MLKLKKKVEEKKAAEKLEDNGVGDTNAVSPEGKEGDLPEPPSSASSSSGGGGLKLLGIGGKEVKKDGARKAKKITPGEIRIQKDIAELDAGAVATVEFPNPKDLTIFNVFVSPDQGYWKNAKYHFTFMVPADYPHTPPTVINSISSFLLPLHHRLSHRSSAARRSTTRISTSRAMCV